LMCSRPSSRLGWSTRATPWRCRSSVAWVLCTSIPSMCTGPSVSSRTRLAMRNASTTPWQYPRGVILRTSTVPPSLREGALADPREQVRLGPLRSQLPPSELVVLGAESQLVDLVLHRREPRVGVVLAPVGAERVALALHVVVHVDPCGHQLVWRACDAHGAAHGPLRLLRHLLHERLHHRARDRRVVELLRRPPFLFDQVDRGVGDEVRLYVVGVAINAVLAVRDDHVRPLLTHEDREPARCFVELGLMKGARVPVVRGVDHARVAVAQELLAVDAEDLVRGAQFPGADLAESRPGFRLVHVVDL